MQVNKYSTISYGINVRRETLRKLHATYKMQMKYIMSHVENENAELNSCPLLAFYFDYYCWKTKS